MSPNWLILCLLCLGIIPSAQAATDNRIFIFGAEHYSEEKHSDEDTQLLKSNMRKQLEFIKAHSSPGEPIVILEEEKPIFPNIDSGPSHLHFKEIGDQNSATYMSWDSLFLQILSLAYLQAAKRGETISYVNVVETAKVRSYYMGKVIELVAANNPDKKIFVFAGTGHVNDGIVKAYLESVGLPYIAETTHKVDVVQESLRDLRKDIADFDRIYGELVKTNLLNLWAKAQNLKETDGNKTVYQDAQFFLQHCRSCACFLRSFTFR